MVGAITSDQELNPAKTSSSLPRRQDSAHGLSSPEHEPCSRASDPRRPASGLSPATGLPCKLSNFGNPDTLAALQDSVYLVLDHGPYQRRILYCGMLCVIVVLMQELALRLIGQPVDHWCRPPPEYGHLSANQWRNQSIPVEVDGSFSACTVYDPPAQDEHLANRSIVNCHEWDYDIRDRTGSIVSQFNLVCDRIFLYDFSTLLPIIGYMILSPVTGIASDRLGRRPVTLVCAITVLLVSLGSSLQARYAYFVTMRILAVSSANAAYLLTFILVYEVTGKARRPLFTLLHYAVASTVVPPFLDTIALLRPSWILSHGFLAVPTLAFVLWCLHLGESPVWQLATWRLHEAEVNVLAAANLNGVDMVTAKAAVHKILHRLRKIERNLEATTSTMVASDSLFQTALMRRCAIAAFFARFSTCAIYYGIMVTDETSDHLEEAAHVVLTTSTYVVIVRAMSTYGIRMTLTAILSALGLNGLVEAALTAGGYGAAIAVAHAGTKALVSCALGLVLCYTGEVFPTHQRSAGVSMALFFGGLGALTGTALVKSVGEKAAPVFKAFFAVMALFSVVAIQWLPQVFIEKIKKRKSAAALSAQEKKAALRKSLAPHGRKNMRHKSKSVKSPKSAKSPQ
ncbi:organic cation transporter protein-like isoform X1 [Dermacentor albipictus]|uniref:organic cation transporter protein-like isoform X1 n=2 Tax=Dermacentor albipictus TaxID=60249 RepID=UPI0031FCAE73